MSNRSSVLVAFLIGACGYPKTGAAPGPVTPATASSAAARWPGTTPASLNGGRDLFLAKCNDCHGYPDVALIGDGRWPGILQEMGPKADLTAEQTETVLRFILAARVDTSTK